MSQTTTNIADFEKSLGELEKLVSLLEKGDLPLEQSLQQFERGVALVRGCQAALKQAELRIQQLSTNARGEEALEDLPFDSELN